MRFDTAVSDLLDEFQENSLNFFVEEDLRFHLCLLLDEAVDGDAAIVNTENNPSTQEYREYTDESLTAPSIERVHREVTVSGADGRFDVLVLESESEIKLSEGSTVIPQNSVEAAFELKYVKNRDHATDISKFYGDIQQLDQLPENVEKHLVIAANKHIFHEEYDSGNTDYRAILEDLRDESEEIAVHYTHIPVD